MALVEEIPMSVPNAGDIPAAIAAALESPQRNDVLPYTATVDVSNRATTVDVSRELFDPHLAVGADVGGNYSEGFTAGASVTGYLFPSSVVTPYVSGRYDVDVGSAGVAQSVGARAGADFNMSVITAGAYAGVDRALSGPGATTQPWAPEVGAYAGIRF
jgi:hypothetical protein